MVGNLPSTLLLPLFKKLIYLFWLHCVFVAALRLSLGLLFVAECAGFSLQWLLLLLSLGCRGLGFSSCGKWAQLPHAMWSLPRPGIKPVSLALAGEFLTTGPPGKSYFTPLMTSVLPVWILTLSTTCFGVSCLYVTKKKKGTQILATLLDWPAETAYSTGPFVPHILS